tara:strand:+ start:493 stop:1119 length:627 start_codon:yes stop_codon:yes gene_type:complete
MEKVDLFFCGDSFTWGEELQGIDNNHRRRERQRFSGVLAKRLGKTHVNISRSGTSNDWIVKKTIEWFEQGNSCDTAIIQFSHEKRWIWYDEVGKPHHMPAKSHNTQAPCKHTALNNYWKNMFLIRNYLKDKCNIIHLNLCEVPRVKNFWYDVVGNIDIIELKPLLRGCRENFAPTLKSNILDNNNNKRFSGAHPSAKGHILIAETICP